MNILFWGIVSTVTLFLFLAAITSFSEKEYRAGTILTIGTIVFLVIIILSAYYIENDFLFRQMSILFILIAGILLFVPFRGYSNNLKNVYEERFHEADAVLSRRALKPDTIKYDNYYKEHPKYKLPDDKARNNPGLLSAKSKYFDPVLFSAADANFSLTELLHTVEELPVSENKVNLDPKGTETFIVKWLLKSGVHSVGFTSLEEHHLYSHKGRGKRDGEQIQRDLPHAIALTVEMDQDMMKHAPAGPTVLESSEQYLRSGLIATKLALLIKNLGYTAKAHIDGNYEVICPLVASDAGLGVIGRMGLLMTPRLGPRVRIAVVTTDIPLNYRKKTADTAAISFCMICNKCSNVCPAKAIPSGEMEKREGIKRWKIDSEACYNYWTISGTDCGRCVISCPFSHPDNWFHRFIKWSLKNNLFFRRMAVKLDDVFYGRKPPVRGLPPWLNFINK